jgi:hypothetical protein
MVIGKATITTIIGLTLLLTATTMEMSLQYSNQIVVAQTTPKVPSPFIAQTPSASSSTDPSSKQSE